MTMLRMALTSLALLLAAGSAGAQDTRDLGLPPPSGSQNPVLPPPSGSQNPILPPQSGQRYMPGVGGPFSGDDIPGSGYRRIRPPRESRSGEIGVAGGLAPSTKPFEGEALARLTDIAPALRRCWHPPVIDGLDTGVMATVRFSLRRDGSLFGQPRVTWETRRTDPALRQRFTDSVVAAVRDCTPMRLSPQLGASIAGRPFSIRFHGRAPSTERQT
ncbi:hypothetical protein [Bosea sp. OK403]|uniref:hypothetical protein n=1 Tax=Bosea sp. OK403 TaxID=1855286 RepID=UPI001113D5D0|nr:hypothetical protein [Bosea sp. OK403]